MLLREDVRPFEHVYCPWSRGRQTYLSARRARKAQLIDASPEVIYRHATTLHDLGQQM